MNKQYVKGIQNGKRFSWWIEVIWLCGFSIPWQGQRQCLSCSKNSGKKSLRKGFWDCQVTSYRALKGHGNSLWEKIIYCIYSPQASGNKPNPYPFRWRGQCCLRRTVLSQPIYIYIYIYIIFNMICLTSSVKKHTSTASTLGVSLVVMNLTNLIWSLSLALANFWLFPWESVVVMSCYFSSWHISGQFWLLVSAHFHSN